MSRSSSSRASSSVIMWRYLGSKMCKHWHAPGSITQLGNGKIGTSLSAKGIMHSSHWHLHNVEKLRRELLCEGLRRGCRRPRVRGLRPERRSIMGRVAGGSDGREGRRSDSIGNHVAPADFARAERGYPNLTTHKKARQSRHNLLKKVILNLTVPYSWGIFLKRDHQACDQPVGR